MLYKTIYAGILSSRHVALTLTLWNYKMDAETTAEQILRLARWRILWQGLKLRSSSKNVVQWPAKKAHDVFNTRKHFRPHLLHLTVFLHWLESAFKRYSHMLFETYYLDIFLLIMGTHRKEYQLEILFDLLLLWIYELRI